MKIKKQKQSNKLLIAAMLCVGGFWVQSADDSHAGRIVNNMTTVIGEIGAVYGNNDEIRELSIWENESFTDYTVATNHNEKMLRGHVGKQVKVTGSVSESGSGAKTLTIRFIDAVKEKEKELIRE